ncbi:Glycosyltransferase involved in cell wall bisynthesis [Rhodonellum ikkaensis]|nr:Glycosyltransferase involved in cell wall bisynthesis [Rhodonellum ikkaensis]
MMPVYNGEKTLPLAISSLLHQTYPFWKCYIINDGSTDGTKDYLNSLQDNRFVVKHFEENKGRPYARQAALDIAEGVYLAFLDADDFYHPEKLRLQIQAFIKHPTIFLVGCGMGSFDKHFIIQSVRSNYDTMELKFEIGKEKFKPARAASMVFLNRAKSIGYNFSLKYAQDTDFFMRYLDDYEYVNISNTLYYYSEFESVTKFKILATNYYGLLLYSQFISRSPFFVFKRMVINLFKIGFKILIIPFVSSKVFLYKRGLPPSDKVYRDFNSTVKLIKK